MCRKKKKILKFRVKVLRRIFRRRKSGKQGYVTKQGCSGCSFPLVVVLESVLLVAAVRHVPSLHLSVFLLLSDIGL